MGQPVAKEMVEINDWPGLVTNMGPDAAASAPGAAAVQENLQTLRPGLLEVRPGTRPVQYDS